MFAASRASNTLLRGARPAAELVLKARPAGTARAFHATPRLPAIPKDPHSAHTVSQRIRQGVKSIPVEIYPLGKRARFHTAHPSFPSSFAAANNARNMQTTRVHQISREQEKAEYVECGTVAVIALGLSFGIYSFVRPMREDPTLRLRRRGPDEH